MPSETVDEVLALLASNKVRDLLACPIDVFAMLLALAVKLGDADERAGRRDRAGTPLLKLFAFVWTVNGERAVRNAYRAGRQHAEANP